MKTYLCNVLCLQPNDQFLHPNQFRYTQSGMECDVVEFQYRSMGITWYRELGGFPVFGLPENVELVQALEPEDFVKDKLDEYVAKDCCGVICHIDDIDDPDNHDESCEQAPQWMKDIYWNGYPK